MEAGWTVSYSESLLTDSTLSRDWNADSGLLYSGGAGPDGATAGRGGRPGCSGQVDGGGKGMGGGMAGELFDISSTHPGTSFELTHLQEDV